MSSTVFLCGALALLCLVSVIITVIGRKQSKDGKCKPMGLGRIFLAIGFLPMAFVTIFSTRFSNPYLLNFLAFVRNPLPVLDLFGTFAGVGEVSFLMNILTAMIFSSTVAITISYDLDVLRQRDHDAVKKPHCKYNAVAQVSDHKEIAVPYIQFCRILS